MDAATKKKAIDDAAAAATAAAPAASRENPQVTRVCSAVQYSTVYDSALQYIISHFFVLFFVFVFSFGSRVSLSE